LAAVPKVYLLRGDDESHIAELLAGFKANLGDASLSDLNTTRFESDSIDLEALRANCLTVPFLATRRLVILEKGRQVLSQLNTADQAKFLQIIEQLPETAALIIVIEDQQVRRKRELSWENERRYAWLLDWLAAHPKDGYLADCALPNDNEMPAWVQKRAQQNGGEFRPDAAQLLATYVGNNTLRANQEVEKLLTYVNSQRPVTAEDVMLLTAQDQEGNIFTLVDALGGRNGPKALEQFRILLETNEILDLTGMIYRQFRLLVQAREILDEGGDSRQFQQELHVLPFIAEKLTSQARQFTMAQLLAIYTRLLAIDEAIKTGGMPGDVVFELFIAELTR